jgi:hypothetical protein
MTWKNGYSTEALIAQIQVAPIESVANILERYKKVLFNSQISIIGPYEAEPDFEKAILQRQNDYLNLLLASTVTDSEVANELWELSEKSSQLTAEYKESIKELLLGGHALHALLKEGRRWGNDNQCAQISLVDLLNKAELERSVFFILRNPYAKEFLEDILLRQKDFSAIPDKNIPIFLRCISENKALNIDQSNEHGPDLIHWGLEKAMCNIFETAPTTKEWFLGLSVLLNKLDPKSFSFYEFPINKFCEKWLSFNVQGGDKDESEGFFTLLTESEEFVSLFCAKFGRSIIEGKKLKVSEAIKLDSIVEKSAFFGNAYLSTKDVEGVLGSMDLNISYWLLFNDAVMLNPDSRNLLRQRTKDTSSELVFNQFNQRVEFLRERYPETFKGEVLPSSISTRDNDAQLSESIAHLVKDSKFIAERIKGAEELSKNIKNILIFVLLIMAIRALF